MFDRTRAELWRTVDLRPELISLEVEDETVQCKNTRYLDP